MTLKRKILISNIIMVCVPVVLAAVLCLVCVKQKGVYYDPLAGDGGALSVSRSALYFHEAGLYSVDWGAIAREVTDDPDIVPSEQARQISELSDMGYHFRVMLDGDVLFQNLDAEDENALAEIEDFDFAEGFLRRGELVLLRDSFAREDGTYLVAAVCNEARADAGVRRSLLPVYMISPAALAVLVFIVLLSVVITNFLLTRWLDRSILAPLDVLKTGAREISNGNLNYRMACDRTDEFGEVCREFDAMREKLRLSETARARYETARRDLLNGVSHDLRSPLTSIRGYAEGLRDGIADTEERRQRYCDAILTRAADLERLTDSLSALTRLEDGAYRLHAETVRVDEFLRQFIAEQTPYLEQNHVLLAYQNDTNGLEASLDAREMRRVLFNLMENSVKHRAADRSRVRLSVKTAERGTKAEIRYADDGPGVREDQLDRIFESFYRGDAARTKPENGSGLGLAVVKSIVEAHGGAVSAYPDGGLGILIVLPAAGEEEQREENTDCRG